MTFADAVRICLTQKYVSFNGRARRSEYWWFYLATIIAGVVAIAVDTALGTYPLLYPITGLALLLPTLGAAIRRLHDTGRSGWWLLIGILPLIGVIVIFVFLVSDSTPGPNQHGENPKGSVGAGLV